MLFKKNGVFKAMNKIVLFPLIFVLLYLLACTEKYPVGGEDNLGKIASDGCTGCHSDQELLKQVADPLPATNGDSGEG